MYYNNYVTNYVIKRKNFGICSECTKKLLVPSWKKCEDCDFKSYKNKYLRKQIKIEKTNLLKLQIKKLKKRKSMRNVNSFELVKAQVIVFDDYSGKVIGYRMF
jgi:hypothetical protein